MPAAPVSQGSSAMASSTRPLQSSSRPLQLSAPGWPGTASHASPPPSAQTFTPLRPHTPRPAVQASPSPAGAQSPGQELQLSDAVQVPSPQTSGAPPLPPSSAIVPPLPPPPLPAAAVVPPDPPAAGPGSGSGAEHEDSRTQTSTTTRRTSKDPSHSDAERPIEAKCHVGKQDSGGRPCRRLSARQGLGSQEPRGH